MQNYVYAEVLFPLFVTNTYRYQVPINFIPIVNLGHKVQVYFKGNKIVSGIIVELITADHIIDGIKPIINCEDKAIVNAFQLKLINWISNYYCSYPSEVLKAAIPSNLLPTSETIYYYNENYNVLSKLNKQEQKIVNILSEIKEADIAEIIKLSLIKNPKKHLESLEEKNIIFANQQFSKEYKIVHEKIANFNLKDFHTNSSNFETISKGAKKQREIIDYLIEKSKLEKKNIYSCSIKYLIDKFNISHNSLYSLEKKKIITIENKEVSRFKFSDLETDTIDYMQDRQLDIYDDIIKLMSSSSKPILLYDYSIDKRIGLYLKLIEQYVLQNKNVLLLLPEISLVNKMFYILQSKIGTKLGVFHSDYSLNHQSEMYLKVLNGEVKVVLGTRSSVFLPFNHLDLIIVDEEHDKSYKQELVAPRYNARDVAVVLSTYHNSNTLLVSSSPSVESYYNAKIDKYHFRELKNIENNSFEPEIKVLDIKKAYHQKQMETHFHPELIFAIEDSLKSGKQVIIYQNKRGYYSQLECANCSWVSLCKNCNTSMSLHKSKNMLFCHYCGAKSEMIYECPICKTTNFINTGSGTELIEDELLSLFPQYNIQRIDFDTSPNIKSLTKITNDFKNNKIDILVGTQLLLRNLCYENVKLLAVMNIDSMLNKIDFRAHEYGFQTINLIRKKMTSTDNQNKQLIIQTYNVNNQSLHFIVNNDYFSLFNMQEAERKLFRYPPFSSMIIVKIKNENKEKLNLASNYLTDKFQSLLTWRFIGVEEPFINKIQNKYILNLHLRCERNSANIKVKAVILQILSDMKAEKQFLGVRADVDVDVV